MSNTKSWKRFVKPTVRAISLVALGAAAALAARKVAVDGLPKIELGKKAENEESAE